MGPLALRLDRWLERLVMAVTRLARAVTHDCAVLVGRAVGHRYADAATAAATLAVLLASWPELFGLTRDLTWLVWVLAAIGAGALAQSHVVVDAHGRSGCERCRGSAAVGMATRAPAARVLTVVHVLDRAGRRLVLVVPVVVVLFVGQPLLAALSMVLVGASCSRGMAQHRRYRLDCGRCHPGGGGGGGGRPSDDWPVLPVPTGVVGSGRS